MGGLPVPRVDQLVSQRVAVLSDVQVMSTHDSCLVNKNHSPDELSNQQLIVFIVSTSSVDDKLLKYTDVLTNIKASTSKKVSMYLEKRRFLSMADRRPFRHPQVRTVAAPAPAMVSGKGIGGMPSPVCKKNLHKQFDIRRQEFTSLFNTLNSRALVAIGSTCWSSLEQKKKVHIS